MMLKEGSTLYVRIDHKIGEAMETEQDAMDCMAYLQEMAKGRLVLAGLFGDIEQECVDGAMLIFEAKDLDEATKLSDADPIIARGFYRYELRKWNLMQVSEGA